VKPKYGTYRHVLADVFVRPGVPSETGAVALGTRPLRDTVKEVLKVTGREKVPKGLLLPEPLFFPVHPAVLAARR
jgi:hypothetical protein